MENIEIYLTTYLKWLYKKDRPVIKYLQDGLNRKEIDELIENLNINLPDELLYLFEWKNGTANIHKNSNSEKVDIWFIPGFFYLSLNEAILLYINQIKSAEQTRLKLKDQDIDSIDYYNSMFFPVFFNGSSEMIVVKCLDNDFKSNSSVHYFSSVDTDLDTLPMLFSNISEMFMIFNRCIEDEVFYVDSMGFLESKIDLINLNEIMNKQ